MDEQESEMRIAFNTLYGSENWSTEILRETFFQVFKSGWVASVDNSEKV